MTDLPRSDVVTHCILQSEFDEIFVKVSVHFVEALYKIWVKAIERYLLHGISDLIVHVQSIIKINK